MENVPLQAPGIKILAFLFLLTVATPILLTLAATFLTGRTNHINPVFLTGAIVIPVFLILSYFLFRLDLSIDKNKLVLASSFYRIDIPLSEIGKDLKIVDLSDRQSVSLKFRSNGFSLPGYHSGWYVSGNDQKIFAALTSTRALYIPTNRGLAILVSAKDPNSLKLRLETLAQCRSGGSAC